MNREALPGLLRVSEVQFESAAARLRAVRERVAECDAQLSVLRVSLARNQCTTGLAFGIKARVELKWRQLGTERLSRLQRQRAALAAEEIKAHTQASRSFGRLAVIRSLLH